MPRGWDALRKTAHATNIEPSFIEPEAPVNTKYTESENTEMTAPATAKVTSTPVATPTETEKPRRGAKKGVPRPPINVGEVTARPSSRTDFSTRMTTTDSNPVFQAVKNAKLNTPTDILVDNDERKIKGALSILRRAGTRLEVGMHIAPKPYPTEKVNGVEKVVLTFKTSAERRVLKKKTEDKK